MKSLTMIIFTALSVTSAQIDTAAAIDTATAVADTPEEAFSITDTVIKSPPADSSSKTDSVTLKDSIMTPLRRPTALPADSDSMRESIPSEKTADVSLEQRNVSSDTSTIDTSLVQNGSYFSAGFGWSLGGFSLLNLWENALPDSLGSFTLTTTSFNIPYDSTADPPQTLVDTARLSFSIKERPASYTMCFPLSLALVCIRENDRLAFSLHGSWMRKIFTATIAAVGDSLTRKADYREKMNVFSAFLAFAYGRKISKEYFSIQDVERTYFNAAVELAPLIACIIRRNVTAPASDVRFGLLKETIASPSRRILHGRAATLRIGLNLVKRLNAVSASDFGIAYCIQGYGYFYEEGKRVVFTAVDPSNGKKGRPLYWISHRFEISIAIMRHHGK